MGFSRLLKPDLFFNSIHEIEADVLKRHDIKGLLVDLDNTLISHEAEELDDCSRAWILKIMGSGISCCIISNNITGKVKRISYDLGISYVGGALKPFKQAFLKGICRLNMPESNIAIIGDQLFTDVLGGKIVGIKTILVRPISRKERFWTEMIRHLEKKIKGRMGIPV
jgi:HAD superfamily phosphatase (TIGR01668 family)